VVNVFAAADSLTLLCSGLTRHPHILALIFGGQRGRIPAVHSRRCAGSLCAASGRMGI